MRRAIAPGVGTYPKIDRSETSKTTGQFGNLTGNGLIFETVTGQRVAAVAASVAAVEHTQGSCVGWMQELFSVSPV